MKIWVLEIGEPLPLEKDVRLHRYGQFTKYLAAKGHDVTWWTSSFSHTPKTHVVESDQDIGLDGVNIKFLFGSGYKKNVSMARIRHNRRFAKSFYEKTSSCPKPDLIIAPIPIIEAAERAVRYGKEKGVPVLVDIRDYWPDELVDLAPKVLRPLARVMLSRAFSSMKYVCLNANGIMGVSQSYVDYGLKFAQRSQNLNDLLFPLGYSQKKYTDPEMLQGRIWRKELNLNMHAFKICFFGTIGRFFDLETVIKAARILEKEFSVLFILGGDGSNLAKYKKMAAGSKSVLFTGWLNGPQISAIMEISHAGLAPYKHDAKMSLPNKPFEYMAGGLPIISSIQGELKAWLTKFNCGITYRANSVEELCQAIRMLKRQEAVRNMMSKNARNLLEEHFSTEKVYLRALEHIKKVVATFSARPQPPN
ncbi:MAG: glycosyltransferase family 4 protein [Pseudomonadota bacterium]|nr:glycosyltransferase family 4 protein [Pseudomonadota bacterium]